MRRGGRVSFGVLCILAAPRSSSRRERAARFIDKKIHFRGARSKLPATEFDIGTPRERKSPKASTPCAVYERFTPAGN